MPPEPASDWSVPTDPGPYRAPCWLPGGHAQTIWPAVLMPRPAVAWQRTRIDTPDGDFLDLDALPGALDAPHVVLLHGLEGSSASPYARALGAVGRAHGWRVTVVHWRGCSGTPNRLPRAYHSGDTAELDWLMPRLAADFVIGVSLGGNVLLRWLGHPDTRTGTLRAAAAISAPQDLRAGAMALAEGFNRLYGRHFLRTLKATSLERLERFPGLYDPGAVRRARTFAAFDDLVTARLHGFASAEDYWARASSGPVLHRITLPTRIIHATNDPFLRAETLADLQQVSPAVRLEYSAGGGHAGFVQGPPPGHGEWMPRRVLHQFAAWLPSPPPRPPADPA